MFEDRESKNLSKGDCKLSHEQREKFGLFARSVIGLSEGSAESYVSYVNGAARVVGCDADAIVRSKEDMQSALSHLAVAKLNDGTRGNYITGIKAYYRFLNNCEYDDQVSDPGVVSRPARNIPFELRNQLNELELRASDQSAAFWHKIVDVSVIVFTAVPAILAVKGVTHWAFLCSCSAMILGLVGACVLIPVLHRPVRQADELYAYGKKFAEGSVSAYEFSPESKTPCEKACERVVSFLIPIAFILMTIAIMCVK